MTIRRARNRHRLPSTAPVVLEFPCQGRKDDGTRTCAPSPQRKAGALSVDPDHTAVLACEDGNGEAVLSKAIPFTDFPFDEIKFYVTNGTILLPSGH